MKDRTRERVALGLGLVAGAAIGLFLNSDKGRKVRHDAGEKVGEMSEKARREFEHLSEEVREKASKFSDDVNHAVDRSREFMANTGETFKEKAQWLKGATEEKLDVVNKDFKAGVDYALTNIKKRAKELQKVSNKS
ncbi:MAG: YtxH domain-containing protein [Phaeodactylibacter sp.]|nr:YtxH domain-containing protein [Phaeodactylibacter sp.]MCB9289771.1 YtxH domain-containing protein [Lewinellaceae bacterium]